MISLAGNDYHRLRHHPRVLEAFVRTAQEVGFGMAASRATTGDHPLYHKLEEKLAVFLQAEAVALVGSGYMASLAGVSASTGGASRVLLAEMAHPSLVQAARATGLEVINLAGSPTRADLVLSDAVSANTGALADTDRLSQECDLVGARLVLDDAHGAGVLGDRGQGSPCSANTVRTGTLSKAFGVFGGWVAGGRSVMEEVRKCPAYVASTPFPLPAAAAAIASLEVIVAEGRVYTLQKLVRWVKGQLIGTRWRQPEGDSPILSFAPGGDTVREALRQSCLAQGVEPTFIQYPGCPPGGHYRFTLHSELSRPDATRLLEAVTAAHP